MTDEKRKQRDERLREKFLDQIMYGLEDIAFRWSKVECKNERERCEGVIRNVLSLFDGVTTYMDRPVDLVVKNITLNDNLYLHEVFLKNLPTNKPN